MLRQAFANLMITLLVVMAALWLWLDPIFDNPANVTLSNHLEKNPLPMKPLPKNLRLVLDPEALALIGDHWGMSWPSSPEMPGDDQEIQKLNDGIKLTLDGNTTGALSALRYRYRAYPQTVSGRRDYETDVLPQDPEELALYGLYRYNRGVLLLELAGAWRSGDDKIRRDLRLALYDLRRAVGAFETLGRKGYWNGADAWSGGVLKDRHAGLPIHSAYANLATAYLRLGRLPGYPRVDVGYMREQVNKYSDENSQLSAMVSLLIQDCLKTRNRTKIDKYRLTMALQNLEAGSRGLSRVEESRLNYMTGIIARRVGRIDPAVTPNDAISFLELAAHQGRKGDPRTAHAAMKELALIYLEIEDDDKFLENLLAVEPGAIEDTLGGPDKSWGLLFTDLAQTGILARGDLSRFFSHIEAREADFASDAIDAQTRVFHDKIVETLAEVFFRDFTDHLVVMSKSGQATRAGRLILDLEAQLQQHNHPIMSNAYRVWCRPHLPRKIQLGMSLEQNPRIYDFLAFAPYLAILLLILYWIWVFRSHRSYAARLFASGYAEDIRQD